MRNCFFKDSSGEKMTKGEKNKFIVGLDLGTTNCCIFFMQNGKAVNVPDEDGNRTFSSMVGFKENGETLAGSQAENTGAFDPRNVIFSHKSAMGQKSIPESMKKRPYKTVIKNGVIYFDTSVGLKAASECAALILRKVIEYCTKVAGKKPDSMVITCPAHFNQGAREEIKRAAEIAGIEVARIINEPTAAALAFGMNSGFNGKVVVFDLGGGTFDVSLLEIDDGSIEVKSTGGDGALGGDNFDEKILEYMMNKFKREHPKAVFAPDGLFRVKQEAQSIKHRLSNGHNANYNVAYCATENGSPVHMKGSMSLVEFERMIEPELTKIRSVVMKTMKDASCDASEIDKVLLVGGSTRVPAVVKVAEDIFGRGKIERGINPDEAVAMGAAIQGGILSGDKGVGDILLLDVTPLSLGIETQGGICTKLIEKNSTIPTKKSQTFSTAVDNQPAVTINVLQGEREMASGNKSLGQFSLEGIAPAPRGVPQIEVTFDIDANGIVHVSAKDKKTGKSQEITIKESNSLSDEEVERMKKDAEENAEADKKKKELVMARHNGEMAIYNAEKIINERKDLEGNEMVPEIKNAIEEVRKKITSDDLEQINEATRVLAEKVGKLPPKPQEKKEESK
jgi:molecular chaperone DnaK